MYVDKRKLFTRSNSFFIVVVRLRKRSFSNINTIGDRVVMINVTIALIVD